MQSRWWVKCIHLVSKSMINIVVYNSLYKHQLLLVIKHICPHRIQIFSMIIMTFLWSSLLSSSSSSLLSSGAAPVYFHRGESYDPFKVLTHSWITLWSFVIIFLIFLFFPYFLLIIPFFSFSFSFFLFFENDRWTATHLSPLACSWLSSSPTHHWHVLYNQRHKMLKLLSSEDTVRYYLLSSEDRS